MKREKSVFYRSKELAITYLEFKRSEYCIFGLGNGGEPKLKHLKKCSFLVQLVFQHDIKSCSLFGIRQGEQPFNIFGSVFVLYYL